MTGFWPPSSEPPCSMAGLPTLPCGQTGPVVEGLPEVWAHSPCHFASVAPPGVNSAKLTKLCDRSFLNFLEDEAAHVCATPSLTPRNATDCLHLATPLPAPEMDMPLSSLMDTNAAACPPMTPQKAADCKEPATPPPAPRIIRPSPSLREALLANSEKQVHEALMDDPDSVHLPFFDHETEPPLCCALKHKCSAEIVRLLLEHGADPEMTDRQNQGPADILRSMRTADTICIDYAGIDAIEQMLGVCPTSSLDLRQQNPLADYTADYAMLSQALFADPRLLDALSLPPWARMDFQALSDPPPWTHRDIQLAAC